METRYRISREIGRGAMGRVYLAHDTLLDRDVALKELVAPGHLPEEERDEVKERFRLEARAAARLTHPYVLTVHDIVASEDRQFIVMEYLDGKTLREILSERVLSAEEVLSIAPMISDALGYAHSHGIIHRDVKPDNIFVLENGNIKVADFGIAKMLMVSDMTQAGVIMGTPNYIAPELVRGMSYDHRIDIFSLGVTLYELLAGRRPFDADSDYAIIFRVASEEPVPLDEIRRDLPETLVRAVHRALEKNPDMRYPGMKEFREDMMAVRAELGMDTVKEEEGEAFDKEKALRDELEAVKELDDYGPAEHKPSGVSDFSRDREWKELIACVYRGGAEGEGGTVPPAKLTAAPPTRSVTREPAQAAERVSYKTPRVKAAVAHEKRDDLADQAGAMRWSAVVVGAGTLTILSVLLPWIGGSLHPGGSLSGFNFPEGMVLAALIALVLGADAFLLLGVGETRKWVKAMKGLSFLCLLLVLVFFVLRVIVGLGLDKAPGIGLADYVKGIGWGLWLALIFSAVTYWACLKTDQASA